jgi:predicted ATPase
MLNSLSLRYFKCFEELHLPLASLTLLSGANASGKSSVLQALVLLHQTMQEHEWSRRLMLNGKSLKLGTVSDVINEQIGGRIFEIAITDNKENIAWTFMGEGDRNEQSVAILSAKQEKNIIPRKEWSFRHLLPNSIARTPDIEALITRLKNLTYITAERIGPREIYPLEDIAVASVVGAKGEHTVSIFHVLRDESILEELICDGEERNTLFHQVTAWMQQFFPECGLAVEKVTNVNAVTLRLRTSKEGNFHLPTNVGFGLTQILPIVVAALSAQEKDILLIENPEVHLHPAGQALMGQFLAKVASAGVQVILETHSDHILNGIRRFVKSGGISPEQVALHFFRARSTDTAQVVSPQINTHGDLDCWPDGFFDQFDKDMNHFAGWD